MSGDLPFNLCDTGKRLVPTRLQFAGHQSVCGIGCIVLSEGAVRRITRGFEIAHQRVTDLIASQARFGLRRISCCDRARLDDLQQGGFDGVIDPQAAKGDTARLTIVEPTARTAVAWDIVLHAAVADCQLAAAAAAADKPGEKRVAVLGRAMMPACRDILAHHPADRLRPLPVDITFVARRAISASHSPRGLRRLVTWSPAPP